MSALSHTTTPLTSNIVRQAESLAMSAIDTLRQYAPEVAPAFENASAKQLITDQYVRILETGSVRWEETV